MYMWWFEFLLDIASGDAQQTGAYVLLAVQESCAGSALPVLDTSISDANNDPLMCNFWRDLFEAMLASHVWTASSCRFVAWISVGTQVPVDASSHKNFLPPPPQKKRKGGGASFFPFNLKGKVDGWKLCFNFFFCFWCIIRSILC